MMYKGIKITLLLCVWTVAATWGQVDPHFSQYLHTPTWLSPAKTGMIQEDARVIANYRDQWRSVTVPFSTAALSYDMKLPFYMGKNCSYFGAGLLFTNETAGDSDFRTTFAQLALAYHQELSGKRNPTYLSAGLMIGGGQRAFSPDGLYFDSQITGIDFDLGMPSGEMFERTNVAFLDISAGLNLSAAIGDYSGFSVGAGLFHINQPNVSFLGDDDQKLDSRFALDLQGKIGLDEMLPLAILPSLVYMRQGRHEEFTIGAAARYQAQEWLFLTLGAHYRSSDAFIPLLRVDVGPLAVGLSYDLNTSELNTASNGDGSMEVMLMYRPTLFNKRKSCNKVFCPW